MATVVRYLVRKRTDMDLHPRHCTLFRTYQDALTTIPQPHFGSTNLIVERLTIRRDSMLKRLQKGISDSARDQRALILFLSIFATTVLLVFGAAAGIIFLAKASHDPDPSFFAFPAGLYIVALIFLLLGGIWDMPKPYDGAVVVDRVAL